MNWNSGKQLRQCLVSIASADQDGFILSRVCVVDNASQDGSLDRIGQYGLPVQVVRNDRNRGFAAACDQGAKDSQADYLLFLNPDTELFKDSLKIPLAFMKRPENEKVAIVGIQLVDGLGQVARTCARFPTPGRFLAKIFGLDRLFPRRFPSHFMREWDHSETLAVDQVMGAFFLVRRSIFESLGGFDERFFVFFEEVDFSYRAYQEGWKSVYLATAQAYHAGGGSSKQIKAQRLFYSLRSRILYGYKHFSLFSATLVMLGTILIEPFLRLILAGLHHSFREATQTGRAYGLLLRDLPSLLRRSVQEREGKMSRMEQKRKILFLTNYPCILAAPRVRVFSYLPLLERAGFECRVITVIPEFLYAFAVRTGRFRNAILYPYQFIMRVAKVLHVIAVASQYDSIYVRGVYFPLRLERVLLRANPHLIFDLVDAVYLRKPLSINLADRIKARLYNQSVLLPRMLAAARAVNLTTPYLREYVRKYCPNVFVTPGPIRLHKCKIYLPKEPHEVVIGWMGSPSTAKYLSDLSEVFIELQRKYEVKIKVIGTGEAYHPPETLSVIKEDWHLETATDQLCSFHIGIMPLRNMPWESGKGGYKLLHYMSVGLPVVASPVGINRELVQDGVNGFLVENQDEWIEKLSLLIEDFELRKELGMQGWKTVRQYTAEAQFGKLKAVLEIAMSD